MQDERALPVWHTPCTITGRAARSAHPQVVRGCHTTTPSKNEKYPSFELVPRPACSSSPGFSYGSSGDCASAVDGRSPEHPSLGAAALPFGLFGEHRQRGVLGACESLRSQEVGEEAPG